MKYIFLLLIVFSCSRTNAIKFDQSQHYPILFGGDKIECDSCSWFTIKRKDSIYIFTKQRKTYKL